MATEREEGGGHVKFYPYEKEGVEKVLAMLQGAHKKCWGSFLAILKGGGGTRSFQSLKGGGGGGQKVLRWFEVGGGV